MVEGKAEAGRWYGQVTIPREQYDEIKKALANALLKVAELEVMLYGNDEETS